jgi:Ca-activated chloride channel homolog
MVGRLWLSRTKLISGVVLEPQTITEVTVGLRMIFRILAVIGILTALLTVPLRAKHARHNVVEEASPKLRLNVDLVALNVIVTDQKGHLVTDLSEGDFKVYENRMEQPVSFFSHEETPVSWGLVLDRSRSMSKMIREVHQAALHLIGEGMGPDEMFVLTFNEEKQLIQDFTSNRDRLTNVLFGLEAAGKTALFDAVAFASEHLQKEGRHSKRALIVVTDGEDNRSELTFPELVEIVQEQDALLYVIGFFEPPDPRQRGLKGWGPRGQLENLAEATGGKAYFPSNLEGCRDAVSKIASEISHEYNLGYYAEVPSTAGEWRKIKVVVNRHAPSGRKYLSRTRTRYFAGGH